MKVDFSLFDLKELDLTMVFWDEILESGSSIQEEIVTQTWSFLYYAALDLFPDSNPSIEEDDRLQAALEEYVCSENIQTWIATKTQEMTVYLQK